MSKQITSQKQIFSLLKVYWKPSLFLTLSTSIANILYLIVPKFISSGIDSYTLGQAITKTFYIEFLLVAFGIFLLTYFQGIFQTYLSQKVAYDIRNNLAEKISTLSYRQLENETPAKVLTHFTSDIDAIKNFFSTAVATSISSIVVLVGAMILLLTINMKLALAVIALLPFIIILFVFVFKKLGPLFKRSQEIIDVFNTIIGESVSGAAIVRVLNTGTIEYSKFEKHNNVSLDNSMKILKYFSFVIPTVGVIANFAALVILVLGGKFVIGGTMSLGDFTAFNSYVFILIFPIIMLGFISSTISRAQESYLRIQKIFEIKEEKKEGTLTSDLKGNIEVKNITMTYEERSVLKNINLNIQAGTKNAIIGPVAAGKTQLLQILFGLSKPTSGEVMYDNTLLNEYDPQTIHSQVAFVFQDSVLFNMSILENIAFSSEVSDEDIKKAVDTSELDEFIDALPHGINTIVSERGTSLSGGQKQRIMLARALALNPRILFLDDFTARVDAVTEKSILKNIEENYPNLTLISVTQKIQSVEHFDTITLLMEGEIVAQGTHTELMNVSPEYMQIMESQKSTQLYE